MVVKVVLKVFCILSKDCNKLCLKSITYNFKCSYLTAQKKHLSKVKTADD